MVMVLPFTCPLTECPSHRLRNKGVIGLIVLLVEYLEGIALCQ